MRKIVLAGAGLALAIANRRTLRPSRRGNRGRRRPMGLRPIAALAPALAVLSALSAGPVAADTHSGYLVNRGVAVYYAVLPAEMIRGHPKQHPEATMHGGVPNRPHVHHLLVALFHERGLERIVDAEITATVGEVGLAGQQKKLEAFTVAGALTYGNYFEMRPRTEYRVRLDIRQKGSKDPAKIEFGFKHQ